MHTRSDDPSALQEFAASLGTRDPKTVVTYQTVTGTDIYRIVDSKIVEQCVEVDMLGLMQQLGVIPAPGHGEARREAEQRQQRQEQ